MGYIHQCISYLQMNKLVARKYPCEFEGCKSCIELERLQTDKTRKSEETHMIVKCKDVETMEKWNKIITKEIANVKRAADIFSNPQLF